MVQKEMTPDDVFVGNKSNMAAQSFSAERVPTIGLGV